jgi:predicted MPP superfamily phosphohydrolase
MLLIEMMIVTLYFFIIILGVDMLCKQVAIENLLNSSFKLRFPLAIFTSKIAWINS